MHVTQLFAHPVKSCRGVSLRRAEFTARGVADDREFALADDEGRVSSQKRVAALARVVVEVREEGLLFRSDGHGELVVDVGDLDEEVTSLALYDRRPTARRVRDERLTGWLAGATGHRARLYRFMDAPFLDLRPVHVVTEESVRELGRRAGRDVELERFRPNLVLAGAEPLAEDRWSTLTIGGVVLDACESTARCRMIGLDPRSGEHDPRVTRALADWRTVDDAVRFGRYFAPRGAGSVAVGDEAVAACSG